MNYSISIEKKWQETEVTSIDHSGIELNDGRTGEPTYKVDVKYKDNEFNNDWKDERTFTDPSEILEFIQEIVVGLDLGIYTNFKFITDLHKIYETLNKF